MEWESTHSHFIHWETLEMLWPQCNAPKLRSCIFQAAVVEWLATVFSPKKSLKGAVSVVSHILDCARAAEVPGPVYCLQTTRSTMHLRLADWQALGSWKYIKVPSVSADLSCLDLDVLKHSGDEFTIARVIVSNSWLWTKVLNNLKTWTVVSRELVVLWTPDLKYQNTNV